MARHWLNYSESNREAAAKAAAPQGHYPTHPATTRISTVG